MTSPTAPAKVPEDNDGRAVEVELDGTLTIIVTQCLGKYYAKAPNLPRNNGLVR